MTHQYFLYNKSIFSNSPKIYNWTYSKVQDALHTGILKGESIDKIANRIQSVTESNRSTAIRNARTSITSAYNQGQMATFERASKMGIDVKKEWIATSDGRTRDSHAHLDGVRVPWDEKFPNGLMCPGDPKGSAEEVYNCRCTMARAVLDEGKNTTGNTAASYNTWKEYKELFNSDEYKASIIEQKDYNKSIKKGELSPLSGFANYQNIKKTIEKDLIGLTTSTGVTIKSYSKHFINRVIGSISQKRSGVSIDELAKALTSGQSTISEIKYKNGIPSQKFSIGNTMVSLNLKTGNLIQANPKKVGK